MTATDTGVTLADPTVILPITTLASYCLVPITRNSVLSSFNIRMSVIIQVRTSDKQFVIDRSTG